MCSLGTYSSVNCIWINMDKLAYIGLKQHKGYNHCTPRLTLYFEQGCLYFSVLGRKRYYFYKMLWALRVREKSAGSWPWKGKSEFCRVPAISRRYRQSKACADFCCVCQGSSCHSGPWVAINMKALSRTRNTSVGSRNSNDLSHALETKLNSEDIMCRVRDEWLKGRN